MQPHAILQAFDKKLLKVATEKFGEVAFVLDYNLQQVLLLRRVPLIFKLLWIILYLKVRLLERLFMD